MRVALSLYLFVALQLFGIVQGQPNEPVQERVTMGPFLLKLAPTPLPIKPDALDALYVYIQQTLVSYMSTVQQGNGWAIKYFVMTDIEIVESEGNVSTFRIGEGAAAFDVQSTEDVPATTQIESMIRAAIENTLVPRLEDTEFYYVQEARYVSISDSAADNGADGIQDGGGLPRAAAGGNGNGANAALAASVAVAGVAILLLGALLIRSQRRRDMATEVHSPVSLETTASTMTHRSSRASPMAAPTMTLPTRTSSIYAEEQSSSPPRPTTSRFDDARSLAESDSSWTVATETGDSAAVHSIATNPSQYTAPGVVASESFENDRQPYLQKDMLTTQWSGQNMAAGTLPTESVLQPSHFSALQERRRKQWTDNDEAPRPFIFTSHDTDIGEEVFLMPDDSFSRGPHSELL